MSKHSDGKEQQETSDIGGSRLEPVMSDLSQSVPAPQTHANINISTNSGCGNVCRSEGAGREQDRELGWGAVNIHNTED